MIGGPELARSDWDPYVDWKSPCQPPSHFSWDRVLRVALLHVSLGGESTTIEFSESVCLCQRGGNRKALVEPGWFDHRLGDSPNERVDVVLTDGLAMWVHSPNRPGASLIHRWSHRGPGTGPCNTVLDPLPILNDLLHDIGDRDEVP